MRVQSASRRQAIHSFSMNAFLGVYFLYVYRELHIQRKDEFGILPMNFKGMAFLGTGLIPASIRKSKVRQPVSPVEELPRKGYAGFAHLAASPFLPLLQPLGHRLPHAKHLVQTAFGQHPGQEKRSCKEIRILVPLACWESR